VSWLAKTPKEVELVKEVRSWKQDYLLMLKEYATTLEEFVEHIDNELRVLEDKEIPLHVAIARVTDSAVRSRSLAPRLEKIRELITILEKTR